MRCADHTVNHTRAAQYAVNPRVAGAPACARRPRMGGDAAQPPDPGWEAPDEPRPRSSPARVDTSARGLAATLKALRREADRAVDAADAHKPRQAPDLTRAERLLVGKGEVFEDIALGAAVTAEATVGLVRRHAHTPRETSLGTWAFGRRMRTVSWATSMKFLAAAAAVVVMCAAPTPPTFPPCPRCGCRAHLLGAPRPAPIITCNCNFQPH